MHRAWCLVCLDPNPVRVKNGPHLQLQAHSVIRGDQWLRPKGGRISIRRRVSTMPET